MDLSSSYKRRLVQDLVNLAAMAATQLSELGEDEMALKVDNAKEHILSLVTTNLFLVTHSIHVFDTAESRYVVTITMYGRITLDSTPPPSQDLLTKPEFNLRAVAESILGMEAFQRYSNAILTPSNAL